jgi:hypothetical protein
MSKKYRSSYESFRDDPEDPIVNPRDLVDPSEIGAKTRRPRARQAVQQCGTHTQRVAYNALHSDGYDPLLKAPKEGLAIDTMSRPLKPPGKIG